MDQESEGTNLVIFVVGGAVLLLLLLLGGGAFFFLMAHSEPIGPDPEGPPFMEGPKVEVVEEGPIHVGPGGDDEAVRPKVAPINKNGPLDNNPPGPAPK